MELYFLRHGIAADEGPAGMGDAGRPLTKDGIAKMQAGARGMRRLGLRLDAMRLQKPACARRQKHVALPLHLRSTRVLRFGIVRSDMHHEEASPL